ncbi:MAG: hypothetical protein WD060_09880 [Pirellulales bacterium]
MRSGLAYLTMLATVMHFTCGCCLHAAHFHVAADCHHGEQVRGDAQACCNGHGGDHDSPGSAGDLGEPALIAAAGTCGCDLSHCGCDGCSCAATVTQGEAGTTWLPSTVSLSEWRDATLMALSRAAAGARRRCRCPVLSVLRPPLYERLLI